MSQQPDWKEYQPTKTTAAVLQFLLAAGFDAKKTTLYRHVQQGVLRRDGQGFFSAAALRRYADQQFAGGGPVAEDPVEENLLTSKIREEIGRIKAERKLKELKYEVESGKYMLVDDAYASMAARAVVLDSGLTYMIQSKAAEFIAMVAGKQERIPELVAAMSAAKDDMLSEYARAEFIVEDRNNRMGEI